MTEAEAVPGLAFSIDQIDATHLAVDARRVDAVITVRAAAAGGEAVAAAPLAEVLIMDRSLSMDRGHKIHEAQRAVCVAIDALPDRALFGVVAGESKAEVIFPPGGGLVRAGARTRTEAKERVMALRPEGGTRIGRWLEAAAGLLAADPAPGAVRHALLYTDGKNEHETAAELDRALAACRGRLVCDVRGLGEDWDYAELLRIAEALNGEAGAVLDSADLAGDFTRLVRKAARMVVPRAYLRLRPDKRFTVASVTQAYPVRADLIQHRPPGGDEAAAEVPLGPWTMETRRYEVSLRFDPDSVPADEIRAAAVELLVETAEGGRERRAHAALPVCRHSLPGFRTQHPASMTQVIRERELGATARACVDKWLNGDAEADAELDRAIRLADELGDVRAAKLRHVAAGSRTDGYRIRPDVTRGEMKRLGLDSRITGLPPGDPEDPEAPKPPGGGSPGPGPARVCPNCAAETAEKNARFCEACGHPLDQRG
ncbi:MAG: VWA domain-containing protein, partial [Nocardiopsaceae bacterium]|nr:VWA domain-containing protein [Nocardiopsaceae bacterium]